MKQGSFINKKNNYRHVMDVTIPYYAMTNKLAYA